MSQSNQPPHTIETVSNGVFQTDLIIRTAILAGIKDLRANSQLLDYCFASLLWDTTTKAELREAQILAAKEWFLNNEIPVLFYPKLDQIRLPCVSVALQDSNENTSTLGQIHYAPSEPGYSPIDIVVGPFAPKSYDLATGVLILPDSLLPFYTNPSMVVVDNSGNTHEIIKNGAGSEIYLNPNTLGNFNKITIKALGPNNSSTKLESAFFTESYSIGCHAQGNPIESIYLSSVILFILLRYRQSFLEARGFERTTLRLGPLIPLENLLDGKENVFSRYLTINGYVQHIWPKETHPNILSVRTGVVINEADHLPAPLTTTNQLWYGTNDAR